MAKIYLVARTNDVDYDEYDSHVVVAKSPSQARQLCAEMAADESPDVWATATTEIVGTPKDPEPRIILSSFNAG